MRITSRELTIIAETYLLLPTVIGRTLDDVAVVLFDQGTPDRQHIIAIALDQPITEPTHVLTRLRRYCDDVEVLAQTTHHMAELNAVIAAAAPQIASVSNGTTFEVLVPARSPRRYLIPVDSPRNADLLSQITPPNRKDIDAGAAEAQAFSADEDSDYLLKTLTSPHPLDDAHTGWVAEVLSRSPGFTLAAQWRSQGMVPDRTLREVASRVPDRAPILDRLLSIR